MFRKIMHYFTVVNFNHITPDETFLFVCLSGCLPVIRDFTLHTSGAGIDGTATFQEILGTKETFPPPSPIQS